MAVQTGQQTMLRPDLVHENPDNPRLIFPEKEMDKLLGSIRESGILVPLTVYREDSGKHAGGYILIDGERRWRCSKRLNMKVVPTYVLPKPASRIEYILRMFNIHNVKEDWKLKPTAMKLKEILDSMPSKNDKEIAVLTGLPLATLKRCRDLLTLPKEYQNMLLEEEAKEEREVTLTEDFFLEMMRATKSIKRFYPDLYEKHMESGLIKAFVEKLQANRLENITDFRKVPKIIAAGREGVPKDRVKTVLTKLIENRNFTIDAAYKDIAEPIVAMNNIIDWCTGLIGELQNLRQRGYRVASRDELVTVLSQLRKKIDESLGTLGERKSRE